MLRILLKIIALGVSGLTLYMAVYEPTLKPDDRPLMFFASAFFLFLFLGSFVSIKYVELPLGLVFLLNGAQGTFTGKITNIFQRYHFGTHIDLEKTPGLFWFAMIFCLVGGIWLVQHAYIVHKREVADKSFNQTRAG